MWGNPQWNTGDQREGWRRLASSSGNHVQDEGCFLYTEQRTAYNQPNLLLVHHQLSRQHLWPKRTVQKIPQPISGNEKRTGRAGKDARSPKPPSLGRGLCAAASAASGHPLARCTEKRCSPRTHRPARRFSPQHSLWVPTAQPHSIATRCSPAATASHSISLFTAWMARHGKFLPFLITFTVLQ